MKQKRKDVKSKASEMIVTAKAKAERKKVSFSKKKELDTVIEDSISEISQIESKTQRLSKKVRITDNDEDIPIKVKKSNKLEIAVADSNFDDAQIAPQV